MAKSSKKKKPARGKKKAAKKKAAKRGAAARKPAARKKGGAKKARKATKAKKTKKTAKAAKPRRMSAVRKAVRKAAPVVTGPVQAAAAVAAVDEFEPVYDAPGDAQMPNEIDLPAIDAGDDEDDEL